MTASVVSAPLSAALSQQVFRATLDVLARPGTIQRLPVGEDADARAAGRMDAPPAALLPLLALADLTTPACVLADDAADSGWADVVRAMTSAAAVPLAQATLVAALRPVSVAELASLRTGSSAAPEDGALACLSVTGLRPAADGADEHVLRLSGPGIPETRRLVATGLPSGFVAARRELTSGFPAGVDLLLITARGDIAGLPRTTLLEEETR